MQPRYEYRSSSWEQHTKTWKHPCFAWTIGLPFWLFQRAAAWYNQTQFSGALRIFEPLGFAIAIVALIGTIVALSITIDEIREERIARQEERGMRKASLLALLYERLEEARRKDAERPPAEKNARAGQIPIFQEMVRLRLNLDSIDASEVNLTPNDLELIKVGAYGIELSEAKLNHAQMNGTNLAGAQFVNAELRKSNFADSFLLWVNFTKAKLARVDFTRAEANTVNFASAELYGAIFSDTNISYSSFFNAKGLTQEQLDSACAYEGAAPMHLPIDHKSKEQLVWRQRDCSKTSK